MTVTISNLAGQLKVGEPLQSGPLTVYPLFEIEEHETVKGKHEPLQYLLLTEALDQQNFVIGEACESGEVNTVVITNMTAMPVLILDGEEIVGAKQNRMVNATILVAAGKVTAIPVSCVERGRWHYRSEQFAKSETFGYSTLRRQKAEQVQLNLQAQRGFAADQSAIWEEIDLKQARMGTHSPTSALHDSYEHYSEKLNKMIESIKLQPGQTGVMVYINNRFTCLDLFDKAETLSKLWFRLLKSYAVEALSTETRKKKSPAPAPATVIEAVDKGEYLKYPSVGLGQDIRLKGQDIVGAGLVIEQQIVHLSVFSAAPAVRESNIYSPHRRRRNLG